MTSDLKNLLRAYGLSKGFWRSPVAPAVVQESFAHRLRMFAEVAGPVFVAFAHDLSRRLDLLPLADCTELAAAEDRSPPSQRAAVLKSIEDNLNLPIDQMFADFDDTPMRRAVFTEWYRAITTQGEPVMVQVIRPESVADLDRQLSRLRVLDRMALPDHGWRQLEISNLLEAFASRLKRSWDLGQQRRWLMSLEAAVVDRRALRVAETLDELCGSKVLTIKAIDGCFVDTVEKESSAAQGGDLARRFCLAWLQQSLLGVVFPSNPIAENFMVCSDGRIAVVNGGVSRLRADERHGLLDYLASVRREDPDLAAALLARQMSTTPEADYERLRRSFRQAEPFRDGGFLDHQKGRRLSNLFFVQWRLATRCGFRQSDRLRQFCGGLAELEKSARTMAPSRDALQQGIDDLRIIAAAFHCRELLGPSRLIAGLERVLPASQELLCRLSEFSLLAKHGDLQNGVSKNRTPGNPKNRDGSDLLVGLLLVMIAVALITPEIASRLAFGAQLESIGAAVFLAMAGVLFWRLARSVNV